MIRNLVPYLRNKDYYNACIKFIEGVSKFYETSYLNIIIILILIFLFLIYTITNKYSKKNIRKQKVHNLENDNKLNKILSFLRQNKSNKNILTDNCVICLENFNNSKNNENKSSKGSDDYSSLNLGIKNKEISTLKCGHQFHKECISKWLEKKNKCPLCRQIVNEELNLDDNKLIWRIQNELNDNQYDFIDFDLLLHNNFYLLNIYKKNSKIKSFSNEGINIDFGGGEQENNNDNISREII